MTRERLWLIKADNEMEQVNLTRSTRTSCGVCQEYHCDCEDTIKLIAELVTALDEAMEMCERERG